MRKNKEVVYLILAILCVWTPMFMGAWDKDKPASSTSLRNSNPEMLANQSALETSFGNEHEFSTGGANTGDHTQGSARSFSQATAPATQIDGGAFASTDLGSLWVDTDDNAFYMLTATTPTWTPVSTEVIATMLGSARVFGSTLGVTGTLTASGAVTVGTTLDVTGNIDPTSYETTNGGFLDEDDMSSDSDTKVASQQSIKAFVNTNRTGWTPTIAAGYAGEESITFPNGLILKQGIESVAANTTDEVTYAIAFPSAFTNSWVQFNAQAVALIEAANSRAKPSSETTILQVTNGHSSTQNISWYAIGY